MNSFYMFILWSHYLFALSWAESRLEFNQKEILIVRFEADSLLWFLIVPSILEVQFSKRIECIFPSKIDHCGMQNWQNIPIWISFLRAAGRCAPHLVMADHHRWCIQQWTTKSYLNQTFPTAFPFCPSCQNFPIPKYCSFNAYVFRSVFLFARVSSCSACRSFFLFLHFHVIFLQTFASAVVCTLYTGVASNFDSIYLCDQRCHLYIKKRTVVHTAANRQRHFCRTKWQRNAKCIASSAVVDRKNTIWTESTERIRDESEVREIESERKKWINDEGKYNRKSFFYIENFIIIILWKYFQWK